MIIAESKNMRVSPADMNRQGLGIVPRLLVREAVILNCLSLFFLFVSILSKELGIFGGIIIIAYLVLRVLQNSFKGFYLFFGVKLMFDAFWNFQIYIPLLGNVSLLILSMIPLSLLLLFRPRTRNLQMKYILILYGAYIVWVVAAMVVNGLGMDFDLLIRQSGVLFGLLIGASYFRSEGDFRLLMLMVFVSTLIPILMSLVQLIPAFANLGIFNMKLDSIRGMRLSGLYFDPATTGMVNVISFLSNSYLFFTGRRRIHVLIFQIACLFSNIVIAMIGSTRSIIIAMLVIMVSLFIRRFRSILLIAPLLLVAMYLMQPNFDRIVARSAKDIRLQSNVREMFQETEFRSMFTGRMSIWQDILEKYNSGDIFQKFFGKGLSSNAHSTYFFLLLQIGIFGMLYYILISIFLLIRILRSPGVGFLRLIAVTSILSFLVIGFSATTIVYTSFQWIIYLIVAGVLNIGFQFRTSTTVGFRK